MKALKQLHELAQHSKDTTYPEDISDRGKVAWNILMQKHQSGEDIYNTELKDAYDKLKRSYSDAVEPLNKRVVLDPTETFNSWYSFQIQTFGDILVPELHLVPSRIKKLEKWLLRPTWEVKLRSTPDSPLASVFDVISISKEDWQHKVTAQVQKTILALRGWEPIIPVYKELKKRIIKGRKPSTAPGKEKYTPPPAGLKVLKEVEKNLTSLVRQAEKRLVQGIYDQTINRIEHFMQNNGGKEPSKFYRGDRYSNNLIYNYVENVEQGRHNRTDYTQPMQLKAGSEQKLMKKSQETAEHLLQMFVAKNLQKLSSIIGKKTSRGTTLTASREQVDVMGGGLQGHIAFDFSDDTSFIVRNKIVYKWSRNSGMFAQYPTTFHEVLFKDGKRKKMVPEKSMNEIWAVE